MSHEDHQGLLTSPAAGHGGASLTSARRLLLSSFCRSTTWERAGHIFLTEGSSLIRLTEALPSEILGRRVRIDPIWGTGDESRCWSTEMVLEHLIEAGSAFAEIIIHLSHEERPWHEIDVVCARPQGGMGARVIADYKSFLDDFGGALSEDIGSTETAATHLHPWYGRLTAHDWHCLAAFHQRAHRQQVERILAGLEVRSTAVCE